MILIALAYEARNSSLCQTIGELLNGCIDLNECKCFLESDHCMDALSYFLTQYKGKYKLYLLW